MPSVRDGFVVKDAKAKYEDALRAKFFGF